MIDKESVRKLALTFPEAEEHDHFGKPSFRVRKKIFATLWQKENLAVLKLSLVDQSVFCDYDSTVFYPVKGAWGKMGWTHVNLGKVRKDMFKDALTLSWRNVAPKKLLTDNTKGAAI